MVSNHADPRMLHRFAARKVLMLFAACAGLVVLSFAFLDRPVADLSRTHLRGNQVFVWFTRIPEPLRPLALIALVVFGVRFATGKLPGKIGGPVLQASLALIVASGFTQQLKYLFGRTWPDTWVNNNPSYFKDGVFGFNFLHGGAGYASFPSGHMTAITAVAIVLWFTLPHMRWLSGLACGLVAIGLMGANYHWLSDIIAGAFIGSCVGAVICKFPSRSSTCQGNC